MVNTIKIRIERFNPDTDEKPYFKEYEIPFHPTMRVLDAVRSIQENLDGDLAYRWNCGMGICGSCAMEVNGQPVLTCKTELKQNMFGIRIRPLKALPIVKDLVADHTLIYEREKKLKLFMHPEKTGSFFKMKQKEVDRARTFRSCIDCMICVDSCRPFRDGNVDFLGPKSIVKVMAYDAHPKDTLDRKDLLEKEGLWRCNTTRCCQNSCPQGIPITDEGIIKVQERKRKNR